MIMEYRRMELHDGSETTREFKSNRPAQGPIGLSIHGYLAHGHCSKRFVREIMIACSVQGHMIQKFIDFAEGMALEGSTG